jgi:hypothetical protein
MDLGWHLAQALPKGSGLLTAMALPELELVRTRQGSEPEPSLRRRLLRLQMKAGLGLATVSVRSQLPGFR